MEQPVIPSRIEQEYLLRIIEAALTVRDHQQFFLWTQGQLQALLPHQLMVCMLFDRDQRLLRCDCVHASVLPKSTLAALSDPATGLAPRLARHCAAEHAFPAISEGARGPLAGFERELAALGLCELLVHGSGALEGGSSVFALFGLPRRPERRQAYFLDLLLPQLHIALLRAGRGGSLLAPAPAPRPARALSGRELELMLCLRQGKGNSEIGALLGISELTVKNHLQRIYRTLSVANRTEAVARCGALHLLPQAGDAL